MIAAIPASITPTFIALGTKAETLDRLRPVLSTAEILPQIAPNVGRWRADPATVLAQIGATAWGGGPMIVRSSCLAEDQATQSMAGRFTTLSDVSPAQLAASIETVIASYGDDSADNQILIQPMCGTVAASGVIFTRDPNTRSPYVIVNYEVGSDDTAAVTGGGGRDLRNFVYFKGKTDNFPDRLTSRLARMVRELEALTGLDALDIEFAQRPDGSLILFQVRPLAIASPSPVSEDGLRGRLERIAGRIASGMEPDPFIHGKRTVYGVMPDWNPAEIIGIRPRPLALSLYRDLVTDSIWAYQRHNYGYKNLRSCPLLVHFNGLPYIDVRVSFNSFVPAGIDDNLADRLVNYYIDRLLESPHLHDKIEFEIIFSCYTPSLPDRLRRLEAFGFDSGDLKVLADHLRVLTNSVIDTKTGLWRTDLEKLSVLERRHRTIMNAPDIDPIHRIYWLLEDCKRYGSLPFAGLARAGFIAMQMLHSLVEIGIMTEAEVSAFMSSLNSISRRIGRDFQGMERAEFLARYGHLRPGTYDILSHRYDEAPDRYFDWSAPKDQPEPNPPFALSLKQMRAIADTLARHGIDSDPVSFFEFIEAAIEGREFAKFAFTRNLSDAMRLFQAFGGELGFSVDDMSFANIGIIKELYASSADPRQILASSIASGRADYEVTQGLLLPPLISDPAQVWAFEMPRSAPNYITLNTATGRVVRDCGEAELADAIVMIPSADPGFDWLFSRPIAGFITCYGGANSHMAIRAAELGLPAVIGAGEILFNRWISASVLTIDCANRTVTIIR